MVCCKKLTTLKSQSDVEKMIVRGARFGVVGTGGFLDPLDATLKKLLKTGEYLNLLCPECKGTV